MAAQEATTIQAGQVWRSPKTWWRVTHVEPGQVRLEGPRGFVRTSTDGGRTVSEPREVMTLAGFAAWVRKTGAVADA